jgi:exodeoxyribonuclease III
MAKKNDDLTICSLNLNGVRAAGKRGFADWITEQQPDHLCLQEVRALPEQVGDELRSPAGYSARWNSAEKKGYAGTAFYSRSAADRYQHGVGLDWADSEGRAVRADFDDMSIVSLYVPSGSSSEERQQRKFESMEHLRGWFTRLLEEDRPIAVCGDINIAHTPLDIHAPKRNEKNSGFLPEEREWLSGILEFGWVDVVRELNPDRAGLYSWWSNRGRAREKDLGWRIDYVLATPSLAARAKEAWIEKDAGLSDHAPVWVRFAR